MIRHVAAIGLVLCLCPSWLSAQTTEFTVNTASANVYKYPSTGSIVIGTAPSGSVFKVTRELGSWVRIVWPNVQDGVAYVHVSMGSITRSVTPDVTRATALTPPPRPAPDSASPTSTPTIVRSQPPRVGAPRPAPPTRSAYVAPPTHLVGVGALIGSTLGFGASARAWSRDRLGVQFEVSRHVLNTAAVPASVTSIQFAPSLLYSVADRVTDFVWVRPYLGGGAGFHRQTFTVAPGAADSVSDNSLGVQAFGGSEFTFASVPQFALSADLGYRWSRTPFAGFQPGGLGVSVSGHWYVK